MNKKNTKKLWEAFPYLYRDKNASIQTSLIPFGFECGDGWFQLLWDLSEKLEPYAAATKDSEIYFAASQVKEKYGTLRFYTNYWSEDVGKLIDEAESKSAITCEDCGQPGQLMSHDGNPYGWYRTQCINCAKQNGYAPPSVEDDE